MKKDKNYNMQSINKVMELYMELKDKIKGRLSEFKQKKENADNKELFIELAFCLLTPQSKAKICWNCVKNLITEDTLFRGNRKEIQKELKGVRFKYKKSAYIIEARKKLLSDEDCTLYNLIRKIETNRKLREWFVKNIKGIGYKEGSHFLRNIGRGEKLAILDRHILRNISDMGIIEKIPRTLTRKRYLAIEREIEDFSSDYDIPMTHLDLLLWAKETGCIFK